MPLSTAKYNDSVRMVGYTEVGLKRAWSPRSFGPESYLPWKMAWLMSGQNSRNTTVIPSREAFSIHR